MSTNKDNSNTKNKYSIHTLFSRPFTIFKIFRIILIVFELLAFLFSIIVLVVYYPVFGISVIIILAIMIGTAYYVIQKRSESYKKETDTLQKVRELSGADVIGRAIHVAGHPMLDREQPLILALLSNRLVFYTDKNSEPLADIDLDSIQAVKTVIYDKERNPRTDVIDTAAQVLQIEFDKKGAVYTGMFRKMRGMRPIDWYHSLQQARYKKD